jgi:hypothetical protein
LRMWLNRQMFDAVCLDLRKLNLDWTLEDRFQIF